MKTNIYTHEVNSKKLNEVSRSKEDLDEIVAFIDFCRKKLSLEGDILVTLVGQGYKIPIQSIVTWSELMDIPYNPNVDTVPKYNVLLRRR